MHYHIHTFQVAIPIDFFYLPIASQLGGFASHQPGLCLGFSLISVSPTSLLQMAPANCENPMISRG